MSKLTCYNCENCMETPQCDITRCPIDPVTSVKDCPNFKPIDCLKTVFDKITASPEVLAETLVFTSYFEDCYYRARAWKSVFFLPNRYRTKEEAIAATVAKLKEVTE